MSRDLSWRVSYRSLLIIWYFSYNLVNPLLSRIVSSNISQIVFNVILILLFVVVISKEKHALKRDTVFVWLFAGFILLITLFFFPEYKSVLFGLSGNQFNFVESVFELNGPLMGYAVIRTESNEKELLKVLKVAAVITWIAFTIKSFNGVVDIRYASFSNQTVQLNYNQVYGFWFLFSLCIFLYCYLVEKEKKYIVPTIICVYQILMYASRTAMISLAVYVVLYLFIESTDKNIKKKILYAVLLILVVLVFTSDAFLSALKSIISGMGLSSKIIDAFISGNNKLDGGREYLYMSGIEYIKNNPLGLGVYSDRYLLNHYVHNILIEIYIDFGWIFGTVFIAYLVSNYIKMFLAEKSIWKSMFIIFFSLWIARLILSYSFWQDTNFWLTIAMIFSWKESQKNKKRMNQLGVIE